MPYVQCTAGHWNDVPTGVHGTPFCGDPNCRAPFGPNTSDTLPLTPPVQAVGLTRGPFFYRCASNHWSVADAELHKDELAFAECGHPRCKAAIAAYASKDRPTAEIFALTAVGIQTIRRFPRDFPKNFKQEGEVDLYDQQVFKHLYGFTKDKFDGGSVKLYVGDTIFAELRSPVETSAFHPYCYPVLTADNLPCSADARYEDIGRQLMQYTPDFLDMLLTVAIRVMKQRHERKDIDALVGVSANSDLILSPLRNTSLVRWHPLSLLCVLVGSAAAETGRGPMGYVNVLAAFQNLKHDARAMWNNWAFVVGQPNAGFESNTKTFLNATQEKVAAVYPSTYGFQGNEPKRNSVGFKGSESMIKRASGATANIADFDRWRSYQKFVKRDIALFSKWQKPSYKVLGGGGSAPTDPEGTFYRKVIRHLEALFSSG